jgi:hypothetical protein
MHLRYTAVDGGNQLKNAAGKWLDQYFKTIDNLVT